MSGLILYTTEDGASRIQLRAYGQTVWLTQAEMAELFDVTTDNISLHLKNIFSDKELEPERTAEKSSVVQREGGRDVRRPVTLYNLDAILAVGYRVRSPRGAGDGTLRAGSQVDARLPCIWSRLAPILLSAFNMGRGHRHMHVSLA
ncbi:MAG: virulence RhuM family protein [Xanthomonadales bacterium]|nr:virulence RhuM family protein [Xanthomonadales bacterium]